ncbi:hypothetical protein FM104_15595 [Microbacterium esteraromaticum]|uniref:Uncharacterized protein n=1 Tax=Microbacterium esteraromaticum TaxID=57043 RepID=A0A1R4KSC4_9MICO|nr:hypothetical protein [Microbacterium esteraromaticum]SJN47037.1 hypothetical protein FM104_15595 [Microbacterium esteraromaticum]
MWLHSTPVLLGTVTLDAAGDTVVTIPADAVFGDHKIVVQALDGSLIGWDTIKIDTASQVGPDGEWLATVILAGTGKRRRADANRLSSELSSWRG